MTSRLNEKFPKAKNNRINVKDYHLANCEFRPRFKQLESELNSKIQAHIKMHEQIKEEITKTQAFICPLCDKKYVDRFYHGAASHFLGCLVKHPGKISETEIQSALKTLYHK